MVVRRRTPRIETVASYKKENKGKSVQARIRLGGFQRVLTALYSALPTVSGMDYEL
jgi:hypothetical protein